MILLFDPRLRGDDDFQVIHTWCDIIHTGCVKPVIKYRARDRKIARPMVTVPGISVGRKMKRFEFGKSVLENLIAMSKQRSLAEAAAQCGIAFCRHSKQIEGLNVINSNDPLKAAIDYAANHEQ